jgi:undecaprenyl-diphosphatase
LKKAIKGILNYLGGHGPLVLIAMLGIVAGTWGFLQLADYASDKKQVRYDYRVHRYFRFHPGPDWFQELNEEFTALGGPWIIVFVCCAVGGYLLLDRKYWALAVLFCTISSGAMLTVALKHVIARESPGGGDIPSFPSGHSMMSAVVYLSIGATLAEMAERRILKLFILLVATFVVLVVGLTRIVLRVHWASDVFAGWCAGLVWALICWVVTQRIEQVRTRRLLPDKPQEAS